MGIISDIFDGLKRISENNPGDKTIQVNTPKMEQPVKSDKPMTYEEYKEYNNSVLAWNFVGDIIRNGHRNLTNKRNHDEIMEELRRR